LHARYSLLDGFGWSFLHHKQKPPGAGGKKPEATNGPPVAGNPKGPSLAAAGRSPDSSTGVTVTAN
jgi:hypothetical protein